MLPFLGAAVLALGATFIAEFGDKSQLLVLAFATRHAALPIIAGIVVASGAVQGLSVLVGAMVGTVLPATAVGVVAGLAFLAAAAWTLRDSGEEPEHEMAPEPAGAHRSALVLAGVVAGTFVIGELGDKTMLTTFALAARQDPAATWVGATAGMVGANLVAVAVGNQLGRRIPPQVVRRGSAALFAIFGLLLLGGAVLGA